MNGRKATAREVRTGDTISNVWAASRGRSVTVHFPTWEKFRRPEGGTVDVICFTGVDNRGERVDKGFGVKADERVFILGEAPTDGETFGSLTGRAVDDDLGDEWLDAEWAGEAA